MNLYNIVKPLLFSMDPEKSHDLITYILEKYPNLLNYKLEDPKLEKTVCGMKFKNPIGLAAGFDKNAKLIEAIENLGFGFMEVGTITPLPQKGNPKPRMTRIPEYQTLINSMGFNNDGLMTIYNRLEKRKPTNLIIGANIGKNKSTPNDDAHSDYTKCFYVLQDVVDYFTINISSPNTPNLRELTKDQYLPKLLESIQTFNKKRSKLKPIFVKISPDIELDEILQIIETCNEFEISGIVSTNTTTRHNYSYGGMSGKPLNSKSKQVSSVIKENSNLTVISSGGIVDKDIAIDRLNTSDLIQLYTGLVYQGPQLPSDILKEILKNPLRK